MYNRILLTSAEIMKNSYKTCVYVTDSLISIRNTSIHGNEATGLVEIIHIRRSYSRYTDREFMTFSGVSVSTPHRASDTINYALHFDLTTITSITIENVTINISSSMTKALQLVVKSKAISVKPDYQIYCSSGTYPYHSKTNNEELTQVTSSCELCPRGTYTLLVNSFHMKDYALLQGRNETISKITDCVQCPYGSVCNEGRSISRGSFFGCD